MKSREDSWAVILLAMLMTALLLTPAACWVIGL